MPTCYLTYDARAKYWLTVSFGILIRRTPVAVHLKSLKIFCDVVYRRSFSRAAEDNSISQSGVSQVITQLENRVCVKLIDRSKRPFALTPEGEMYYEGCRK